jgi:hypothetical protein
MNKTTTNNKENQYRGKSELTEYTHVCRRQLFVSYFFHNHWKSLVQVVFSVHRKMKDVNKKFPVL